MQSQTGDLLTPSYGCEHQTMESSKFSRASMTSQQRKLYESGMYFPEKVIYTARIDVKTVNEEWQEDYPIKLTSQAFGFIPISSITKIKYYRNSESEKLILKIIASNQQSFFQIKKQDAGKIFSMIGWGKLATMNIFSDMDEECKKGIKGNIYKKSYIFKSWELKIASISKQKGLELSKDKQSSPSQVITSTNEIWTRFETIKNETYVVIKLWHGIMKQEYAVPVEDAVQWMQAFCSLLN